MSQLVAPRIPLSREGYIGTFAHNVDRMTDALDNSLDAWHRVLSPDEIDQPRRPEADVELADWVRLAGRMVGLADQLLMLDAARHRVPDETQKQLLLAAARLRGALSQAVEARRAWHIPARMSAHRRLGRLPINPL